MKKYKKLLISLLVLVLSVFGFTLIISADENDGEITINKTATKLFSEDATAAQKNLIYGNEAQVTLDVNGKFYSKNKDLNIVLIIDKSGSMKHNDDGSQTFNVPENDRRITKANSAATSFINSVMKNSDGTNNDKIYMGVVEFSAEYAGSLKDDKNNTVASKTHNMSNDVDVVSEYINTTTGGATNYSAALKQANALLDQAESIKKNSDGSDRNAKNILIFLTDGVPTVYDYTYTNINGKEVTEEFGHGNYDYAQCIELKTDASWSSYHVLRDENGKFYYRDSKNNRNEITSNSNKNTINNTCKTWIKPSDIALLEMNNIKSKHPQSDIYTVMYGTDSKSVLDKINPPTTDKDASPKYVNESAKTGVELYNYFKSILADMMPVGENSIVTDTIPEGFELTEEAKKKLEEDKSVTIKYENGKTILEWNIGEIKDGNNKLVYNIKTKDGHYGSMYTNESATLKTTVSKDNPFYKNQFTENDGDTKEIELTFDKPSVEMPTKTDNDSYETNKTYEGNSLETLKGSTILSNDIQKENSKLEDKITRYEEISKKYGKDREVSTSDEVEIIADGKKVVLSGNKYIINEIQNEGTKDEKVVKLGELTLNTTTGQFEFKSTTEVKEDTEISFDYRVKTNIKDNHNETDYVLSNTSTVTLCIHPLPTEYEFTKIWKDNGENTRDSYGVTLYKKDGNNEVKVGEEVALTKKQASYKWTDLDKYENGKLIEYFVKETTIPKGYTPSVNGNVITNILNKKLEELLPVDLTIKKIDSKTTTNQNISGAEFTIYDDEDCKNVSTNVTKVPTNDGTYKYSFAKDGNYYIKETKAPTGYELSNTVYLVKVVKGNVTDVVYVESADAWKDKIQLIFGEMANFNNKTNTLTIKNDPETINISATKKWDDNNDQDGLRDNVVFALYDGTKSVDSKTISKTATGKDLTVTFTDLAKYRDGQLINYTVKEETTLNGYTTNPSNKTVNNGGTITNTHIPDVTSYSFEKVWDDNNNAYNKQTSYGVTLYKTVNKTKTKVYDEIIMSNTELTKTWNNLPKYENGKEIIYSVEETTVPTGYDKSEQSTNGKTTIKNTMKVVEENLIPVELTINKTDKNTGNSISGAEFTVSKDNKVLSTIKGTLKYTFVTDGTYTIEETKAPTGYVLDDSQKTVVVSKSNNYTLTFDSTKNKWIKTYQLQITSENVTNNTLNISNTPNMIEVSITKVWDDSSNQDGLRDNLSFGLFENDGTNPIATQTLAKDARSLVVKFEKLPEYRDGNKIIYSIKELNSINGYTTIYEKASNGDNKNYALNGETITNKHIADTIDHSFQKEWDDSTSEYRDSFGITLYKTVNGVEKAVGNEITLSKDKLTHEWKDLPKFENGVEIKYSVKETTVPNGYTQSSETANGKTTITNTLNPIGEVLVPVELTINKVDKNTNNTITGAEFTVSKDNELLATLSNTLKYEFTVDGNYSIVETKAPTGYELNSTPKTVVVSKSSTYTSTFDSKTGKWVRTYNLEITSSNVTNKVLTVTNAPSKTSISATKVWDDNNNQDGLRNDVVFALFDGSTRLDSKTISKTATGNDLTVTFTDLDGYRNGSPINYTVKEETTISGYTTTPTNKTVENGGTITNAHTPGKIDFPVKKIWNDESNKEGKRPSEITINLIAKVNEKEVRELSKTQTLTGTSNEWTYTFKDLDEFHNGVKVEYSVEEIKVTGYTTSINGGNITNTLDRIVEEENSIDLTIKKVDSKTTSGTNLSGAEFTVYEDEACTVATTNVIKVTDATELYKFNFLKNGTYYIKETKAPTGYVLGDTIYKIVVVRDQVVSMEYKTGDNGYWLKTWSLAFDKENSNKEAFNAETKTLVVKNDPETINVTATKVWDDNDDQDGLRTDVVFALYDGTTRVKSETISKDATDLTVTFSNLNKYRDGQLINYTVKEETTISGYTTTPSNKTVENGGTITNKHIPATTEYEVTKVWDDNDNQDNKRPQSITVNLIAKVNDVEVTSLNKTEVITGTGNTWTYKFEGLDKYHNGILVNYSVTENTVESYAGVVEGNTITNTHKPQKITIKGTKTWVDSNDEDGLRPENITVRLYADDVEIDSTNVTKDEKAIDDNTWYYEFKNLDKYKAQKEIVYTVKEDSVNLYETKVEGFNIINTHNPRKITVSGTKTWDDEANIFGRPTSITVNLKATVDGVELTELADSKTITARDDWKYEFTNLPEYKDGKLINYDVTENAIRDYTTSYTKVDNVETNKVIDIKNTYTPEKIKINGTKTWDDNDNQDGIRPETIKLNLVGKVNGVINEKLSQQITVRPNENGIWEYEINDLVKYANGVEIKYSITEETVEGYTTDIPENSYSITNTHTPETVNYTVKKVWDDFKNNDGIRPDSITVKLFANNELKETVVMSDENEWTYSFNDLPKYYNQGQLIVYTIVEESVEAYTPTYTIETSEDEKENTVTITNVHIPEEVTLVINKEWDDLDNIDNVRPNEIEVTIYKDGEVYDAITISKDDDWKYLVQVLVYNQGKKVTYTIKEKTIDGYTANYSEEDNVFKITNTYRPAKGEIAPPVTGTIAINSDTNNIFYELMLLIVSIIASAIYRKKVNE